MQGGTIPALRRTCAEALLETGFDGFGFGGLAAALELGQETRPVLPGFERFEELDHRRFVGAARRWGVTADEGEHRGGACESLHRSPRV